MLENRGVRQIWRLSDEHRRTSAEARKSVELSGKPDAWKLARPVWGWGRGAVPRPTPRGGPTLGAPVVENYFLLRRVRMKTHWLLFTLLIIGSLGAGPTSHTATSGKAPTYQGKTLQDWVAQSKNKDQSIRQQAASALGNLGPTGVPALTELLDDEKRDVRLAAIEALGKLGPNAKTAIPALVQSCKSGDYYLVDSNVESLRKIGPAAVPAITELLGDNASEIRRAAAWALKQMGAEAAPAIPALRNLVKEGRDFVSSVAASALATIGPPAIPALSELLKDQDWYVRWRAVWTLREMGPRAKSAASALLPLLTDSNAMVREAAAEALGKIGSVTAPRLQMRSRTRMRRFAVPLPSHSARQMRKPRQ